jgi:hypothetical protein
MTRAHQSRFAQWLGVVSLVAALLVAAACYLSAPAAAPGSQPAAASSYDQITPLLLGQETFRARLDKDRADNPAVTTRQRTLLDERYDLSPRPHATQTMSRGKPVPVGPTARLPAGVTWEKLAALSPEEIRAKGLLPPGLLPLPHPKHAVGGMVFPQAQLKQFARLERFDVEFDLPDHFLPETPPAMYLTTRPDLGDVSRGKIVTAENVHELFDGVLNPKQLEGLRLLVTQFPQQLTGRH